MRRNVAKQVTKHGFFLPPIEACVLNMEVAQLTVIEKIPAGSEQIESNDGGIFCFSRNYAFRITEGRMVKKEHYLYTLCFLKESISHKRYHFWQSDDCYFLDGNSLVHRP